jgi:hypothetical protein
MRSYRRATEPQRRSALLLAAGLSLPDSQFRKLMSHQDDRLDVLACKLSLRSRCRNDRESAVARLKQLRQGADWILAMGIERALQEEEQAQLI